MHRTTTLLLLTLLIGFASPLGAWVWDASNCGSCFGSVYTLSSGVNVTDNVWDFTYTINTNGFTKDASAWISEAAIKVGTDVVAATLPVAPPNTPAWNVVLSGLDGQGCGNGGGGWVCAQLGNDTSTPVGPPVAGGPTYTWVFRVTLAPGTLPLETPSIKARYVSEDHPNGWVTSETAVPEGFAGELPLAFFGLACWVGWRNRSRLSRAV